MTAKEMFEALNIIRAISWRKNFIARLFCKHKYGYFGIEGHIMPLCGEDNYIICEKCGKYKGHIFMPYD